MRHPEKRSQDLIFRSHLDDPFRHSMALECGACALRDLCGGLSIREPIMGCLDFCCGNSPKCTVVCKNKAATYVSQIREIRGFSFDTIPRVQPLAVELESGSVPLIYHGSSRVEAFARPTVALRLSDLVNFRMKRLNFSNRSQLIEAFKIDNNTDVILTGVNQDKWVEPWWSLNDYREEIIAGISNLGIKLVTTPNFSLLLNNPRMDDLHAMKRIAILFSEFQSAGIACALHPNARTVRDFERWCEFVALRNEVQVISYEFITGSGNAFRMPFHLEGLASIAKAAGRDLDIVVRGNPAVVPHLRKSFRSVVYLDTTAFMKTLHRQLAVRAGNDALAWSSKAKRNGAHLDDLLVHNDQERTAQVNSTFFATDV